MRKNERLGGQPWSHGSNGRACSAAFGGFLLLACGANAGVSVESSAPGQPASLPADDRCPTGLIVARGLCVTNGNATSLPSSNVSAADRASWEGLERRWAAHIHRYEPTPRPGRSVALNAARLPYARYLLAMHERLHVIFSDSYLAAIDELPVVHPLNQLATPLSPGGAARGPSDPSPSGLRSVVNVVLRASDGAVVELGIVAPSGVDAFDAAALESVWRASPFGAPPEAILSADTNVHFEWHFYRSPRFACAAINAHPAIFR